MAQGLDVAESIRVAGAIAHGALRRSESPRQAGGAEAQFWCGAIAARGAELTGRGGFQPETALGTDLPTARTLGESLETMLFSC